MRRVMLSIATALAICSPVRAEMLEAERIVPAEELANAVAVTNVRGEDGVVSGTVVNRSGKTLRDLRLVARYNWLWNREMRPGPGTDDPSRAEYFTVPGDIPPGGRADFTYRPQMPLPQRSDGHFDTQVRVASVVEVAPGGTPEARQPSPTAGVGERIPPEDE